MTEIQTKIAKWGNGIGLHLSKDVARTLNIEANDLVTLNVTNSCITVTPVYDIPGHAHISEFAQIFREAEHKSKSPMSTDETTPKMHWTGEQVPNNYSQQEENEWLKQDLINYGPIKRKIKKG